MLLPLSSHTIIVLNSLIGIIAVASIATIAVELGLKEILKARNA